MNENIEIPVAKKLQVVAVKEWDKNFLSQTWNVYVINNRDDVIETVLVVSRGFSDTQKTSVLRRNIGNLPAHSGHKIEPITEAVLGFTNEYLVTFFAGGKLYERTFSFKPHRIADKNTLFVDLMGQHCVIAD